jgi:3-phosphoshikimate 1-carboxyvinyltransferase
MGAALESDGSLVSLNPLTSPLKAISFTIPGDISSAAYFLVAGAVHPDARIMVRGCGFNPTRTGIIDALLAMGAKLRIKNERMSGNEPVADIVVESSKLRGIELGGEMIPLLIDEIPLLAVAGCFASGKTVIRDAAELRVKESDRIATVSRELTKMGAKIEELPDGMIVYGGKSLSGAVIESHLDHRLAMSLAIAGLMAKGETVINQAQVVNVSYPSFWSAVADIVKQ